MPCNISFELQYVTTFIIIFSLIFLGFTCWILTRMFQILSYSECKQIHTKCYQIVIAILKLVQEKDIVFFYKLAEQTLSLYNDVIRLAEHLLHLDCVNLDESVYCNYFMDFTVSFIMMSWN